MKKLLSGLFVAVFALGSLSAVACPGDKAKDGQPEFKVFKAQDPKCKKFVGQ